MTSVAIPLEVGDVVTNLTFLSGATAAGTPTNYWFALYDTSATPALIAQSADQTHHGLGGEHGDHAGPVDGVHGDHGGRLLRGSHGEGDHAADPGRRDAGERGCGRCVVTGQAILAQTSGSALTDHGPGDDRLPDDGGDHSLRGRVLSPATLPDLY
jgi:hypothetical protein